MYSEKYRAGKMIRFKIPRMSMGTWKLPGKRIPVPRMIEVSNYDRVAALVPVRHFRMSSSPFAFYRATASIMASDLSATPSTGIIVQACGDCHLMNFGGFATPERNLIMDINDFDETLPGYWEWDLKRLAVSFELAARDKGLGRRAGEELVMELVARYQESIQNFSTMAYLDLWYMKFDLEQMISRSKDMVVKQRLARALERGKKQSQQGSFYKLTSDNLGQFSIAEQPPLIYHPFDMDESRTMIRHFLEQYKHTLQPDRVLLLDQYHLTDIALKVVGVGSVGTRCYVILLMNDNKEPLFLQVKEARQSVLESYIKKSVYRHSGERVVQGQRLIQSASDIFLGWATGLKGRQFYLRQLRDKKISPDIESMNKSLLALYAKYCAMVLAKAHCKTNKGAVISGYMGKGESFAKAITRFSNSYADQTERDYRDFMQSIRKGKLKMAKTADPEKLLVKGKSGK